MENRMPIQQVKIDECKRLKLVHLPTRRIQISESPEYMSESSSQSQSFQMLRNPFRNRAEQNEQPAFESPPQNLVQNYRMPDLPQTEFQKQPLRNMRSTNYEYEVYPRESLCRKVTVVFAAMLIQGGIGFASTWGNIVIYVTSYMRTFESNSNLTI